MFYAIKDNKLIWYWQSRNDLDWVWIDLIIEKDFSQEELEKLNSGYLYIDWEIVGTQEAIDQIKAKKTTEIKQKYQDTIFSRYSLTNQLNMWHEAIFIVSMAAFEKRDLTAEEVIRLTEKKEAKLWIDEQIQCCADEIDLITNTTNPPTEVKEVTN